MPEIGEIKRGRDLGLIDKSRKFVWTACEVCGKERWVQTVKGKAAHTRCLSCHNRETALLYGLGKLSGERSPTWKGGRRKHSDGYIVVTVEQGSFFHPMATKHGTIMEHRLAMAKHLGRCLHLWEIVHHKNHIKDDNRIENLELVSDIGHKARTNLEQRIAHLERRITILEAENVLLKSQVSIYPPQIEEKK